MNSWQLFVLLFLTIPMNLSSSAPIRTDYAIYLFDNGDKNMIASMLNYARKYDASTLENLDFRIIFMGPSVEGMSREPFCFYPDKLIHYKQLGIEETVDHHWPREGKLNSFSIKNQGQKLEVQKKVWLGVSCAIFEQMLQYYQNDMRVETFVLRDNPSPEGDSDYFLVADKIQKLARKVGVPSEAARAHFISSDQQVIVIGHGPIEEWCEQASGVNFEEIIEYLGLNPQLPIIVYTGSYGNYYENSFKKFLELVPDEDIQILIVPHPRYKGIVEKRVLANTDWSKARISIVCDSEPAKNVKTLEVARIADAIVVSDATSTIVVQANAIRKKVLYVNPQASRIADALCANKLIQKMTQPEQFVDLLNEIHLLKDSGQVAQSRDVFELLGIPRNGAKLLWNEFVN